MDVKALTDTNRKAHVCPKCSYRQEDAFECLRCGVIFHKFKARDHAATLETSHRGNVTSQSKTKTRYFLQHKVILYWVLVAIAIFSLLHRYAHRPIVYGNGMIAPESPQQVNIRHLPPFRHKNYIITPMATFTIEARVLASTRYRFDKGADLAPYDLALGWGPMSDEAVLNELTITQRTRFYYWRSKRFPIPPYAIVANSTNTHLIPSDGSIAKQLSRVRKGHVVTIKGFLVRVNKDGDSSPWVSSLVREDTGAGACELIWVEEMAVH